MEIAKKLIKQGLLIFALISVGFLLGKHSVKSSFSEGEQMLDRTSHVVVYYMHSTFRCTTCNTIEKMTWELLNRTYSQELVSGQIQWEEEDFLENERLAKEFGVTASCVVVARVDDGRVLDFKRLDDVWTMMKESVAFDKYISDAINFYLENEGGQA